MKNKILKIYYIISILLINLLILIKNDYLNELSTDLLNENI